MNIANMMSMLRIALTPVFLWFLYKAEWRIAITIFVVIALTDILDGYIARRFKEVTKLGKFLDSLADKLIPLPTVLILIFVHGFPKYYLLVLTGLLAPVPGKGLPQGCTVTRQPYGRWQRSL